eukprot:CAMPEP_0196588240 /NCGR_PEP_ID=MMETSP1081-20130531/59954_1 /TAXON_ID=36882 /ORGANISM="Pyramimonas amylifera, Strain CCMP720" /LENGTH=215 /DNA_ID=CAMNT_0041910685 /DNA_START=27 /DNA_END=671 /DNA_ORIENTATION=-
MGATAGPKYGPNTKYIIQHLPADSLSRLASNADLKGFPAFGHYADQEDVSEALTEWRSIRRVIMKRPGLATVEKLLDTAGASVVISSAFHPPYTARMVEILERLEVPAMLILRKGLEGSLAFPLVAGRKAQALCSVRLPSGAYLRHEYTFGCEQAGEDPEQDELDCKRLGPGLPSSEAIADLIQKYHTNNGISGDVVFDKRVRVTLKGINEGIEW